jgi:uncharacterized protein (TIGR00290 family)
MALAELMADDSRSVAALLTTVTEGYERVSMHGVRLTLLHRQAAALGLPLHIVPIPQNASNGSYESRMEAAFERFRAKGVSTIAFGDLFLSDVRRYREEWLARTGMTPVFPIWHRNTADLARRFIAEGFKAILTCVDTQVLDRSFAGRAFDHTLLADLPPAVDPCGENGEFHTFVFDGPIFHRTIRVLRGESVQRDVWCFCDLIPA